MSLFQKATKKKSKLRICIEGASGSGKTWSSLLIATEIAKAVGGRVAVIDTERGSASLYSDYFDFDVMELVGDYSPEKYIGAIAKAEELGYAVILLDTITPEWKGKNGCLEIHANLGGRFQDWKKVTPRHDAFIQALLTSSSHIVTTCRSKTHHEMDPNTKKVTKQGLAPEQRDGLDYEMTVVFDLNQNHMATASKDRTKLFDGKDHIISKETAKILMDWLNSGEEDKNAEHYKTEAIHWYNKVKEQMGEDTAKLVVEGLSSHKERIEKLKEKLKNE